MDLDSEHMAKAAREALTRPGDSMWFDDRLFTTHGCVYTWADRSDDVLAESNYYAMKAALEAAIAHDESGASEARGDDLIDSGARHWAYGSVEHLFVRVYVDADAEQLEYTPAFIEAVRCADSLREYPVLDESDFSEREYAAWERTVSDEFDWSYRSYPDDTDAERQLIWYELTTGDGRDALYDRTYPEGGDVGKLIEETRNAYFEMLVSMRNAPAPGDVALFN